jgi:hypothetical protein
MMKTTFKNAKYEQFYDRASGRTFSDILFERCVFESCAVSITKDPALRTTIRNVHLINCEEAGCSLKPAIVEDVLVDGLKTSGLFQAWGAVFKHVVLKGRIGRIMISDSLFPSSDTTSAHRKAFADANATFYSNVDWALDISEAEFEECDIRGIPARMIRRDPETQVVVTREKALGGAWRELDLSKTYWATAIEFMLDQQESDTVLVAPKGNRRFRDLVHGLEILQAAGVAEPD